MLLRKQGVNKEIKKEIKKYLETNDKTQLHKIDGMLQKQFLEGSSQQYRLSLKISIKQLNKNQTKKNKQNLKLAEEEIINNGEEKIKQKFKKEQKKNQ